MWIPSPPWDKPFWLYISEPSLPQTSGTKFKIQLLALRPQWAICSNLLIWFSIIRARPKRLNALGEVNKRLKWPQWLCPLRDHQRRTQAFWANLAMVDHKAHGYPDKISVPCVDRRDTGGKTDWCVPCKQPSHWQRECPRCQWAMGAP